MNNLTNFHLHSDNSICSVNLSTTRWELDGSILEWGGDWAAGEPNNYRNKENCAVYSEVSILFLVSMFLLLNTIFCL